MKTGDRITGLVLSIIGGAVWIYVNNLNTGSLSLVDAAFFPKVIGISLIISGAFLFINTYLFGSIGKKDERIYIFRKEIILIIIYAVYIIALPFLGFLVLTPILLIAVPIFLGAKGLFSNIISGVIMSIGIYLSFRYLLSVPLPAGIFS